jgi:6-pyruvoyl-tetrahydropterin synthase related domain
MSEARKSNDEVNVGGALPARRPVKVYVLGLLLALALGAALVAPYFFSHTMLIGGKQEYVPILTHDLTNHFFYMDQFQKGVRSGVLYPRWFADANNSYGIAVMNYYPPGFYYTTTLVNAFFNNWHTTLFVLMALMMAAAGLAMYFLARAFFSRAASVGAALVYMLLPYHLLDLYWRGALPEIFGFIFMPLIFYFVYKTGSDGALRHIAGLGLCYGLHLVTHFPVGVMFSYALAFYAVVWALRAKDWRILARIAIGMSIGLAISAIYWLPAALEMKLVYEYTQEIFPYHQSYIQPVVNPDPFNSIIISSLKLNALLIIIVWLIYRLSPRPSGTAASSVADVTDEARRLQIGLWLLVGGASLFMTTAFSYDIGRWLPKLELTVPPFRWLAVGTLFGALLAGAGIERLRRSEGFSPRQLWALRVAFGLVVALNLWVSGNGVIGGALKNGSFVPPNDYAESSMTPQDATRPGQLPDTPLVVIEPPGGSSNILTWKPQRREIRVQLEQPSRVRLKTYNFPGWTARVDGAGVPMASDADGIQVVEVPAGVHTIDVRFQNTTPRWIGIWLTLLGFIAVFGLTVVSRVQARRQSRTATAAGVAGNAGAGRWVRYAVIAGTVLVALVILGLLVMRLNRNQPPTARPAPEQRRTAISVGTEAVLFLDGQESVFVALDEQGLPELLGAVAAKENAKVDDLIRSGRVVRVANNTKVQVMEMAAGKTKVRITEGERVMQTGWVVDRWVR